MKAIVFFKKGKSARYGLPKFLPTVTGEIVQENASVISLIPLRCLKRKVRNIQKSDTIKIEYF